MSSYGTSNTTRGKDLAHLMAAIAQFFGILNPGSSGAAAVPEAGEPNTGGQIASNTLNVTRVGGFAALIATVGTAMITVLGVDKTTDATAIVVAAYGAIGLVVSAALIAAAIMIAADLRARAIATGAPASPSHTAFKLVQGADKTEATMSADDDIVLVNADEGNVALTLPAPSTSPNHLKTIRRLDDDLTHEVMIVAPDHAFGPEKLKPKEEVRIYASNGKWEKL